MKKYFVVFLFLITIITSGYKKPDVYVIEPDNNSYYHNNMGLRYLDERCYYAAIQEFKLAISLNPGTQSCATYFNNLGETYMLIGYPKLAQDCFLRAIKQYPLSFKFYQNLAKCYSAQGLTDLEIKYYSKDTKNPMNMILVGLLYIEKGDKRKGIVKLDEFLMQEPDLLITNAVKAYLKELMKNM